MPEEMIAPRPRWLVPAMLAGTLLALAFVGWAFADRAAGPQIREPLTWDEALNLENYTWLAFTNDGSPRRIARADDLLRQPKPSGTQLGAGLYRAVGVWREPNDHVPHSVMLNAAMLLAPADERVARLPALLGALVFTLAVGWFARQSGSRLAWPVALVLAAAWPYVHTYALQARGYSWMLAFQVLHLLALRQVARKPASVGWGAVSALVGILTFLNIVSLALDWLLPLYAVLWLFPPPDSDVNRIAYRRNLLVQFGVITLAGLIFLADHLPYVVVSMREFGVRAPLAELPARLREIGEYLFPTLGWQIVAGVGVFGWLLMLSDRETRAVGLIAVAVVAVSLLHFAGTHKVPYPRTCGYVLPLLVLGAAFAVEQLLGAVTDFAAAVARLVLVLGVAGFAFLQLAGPREQTSDLVQYRHDLRSANVPGRPYALIDRDTYIRIRHLPAEYHTATDDPAALADVDALVLMGPPTLVKGTPAEAWPVYPAGDREISYKPAKAGPLREDSAPQAYPAVVLWIPNADQLGLRSDSLTTALGDQSGHMRKHYRQVFNKLEFSNQVYAAEFLATNPADFADIRAAVIKGQATLGGTAILIEPSR